jgi:hypothetical protein
MNDYQRVSVSRREFMRHAIGATAAASLFSVRPCAGLQGLVDPAQKAVIVTFGGGARDDETFSIDGQQYIPHLLNTLAPQSCFFTQVINRGILGHYVATASIATGTYETFDNFVTQPPARPTIFEYFRKDRRSPRKDAWGIAPGNLFSQMGASRDRRFGPDAGAETIVPKQMLAAALGAAGIAQLDSYPDLLRDNYEMIPALPNTGTEIRDTTLHIAEQLGLDAASLRKAAQTLASPDELSVFLARHVMRQFAPSLLFLTLHDIDIAHSGAFSLYLDGIRRTDRLCAEIWTEIQTNPEYKDRTSLFILLDFGRGWRCRQRRLRLSAPSHRQPLGSHHLDDGSGAGNSPEDGRRPAHRIHRPRLCRRQPAAFRPFSFAGQADSGAALMSSWMQADSFSSYPPEGAALARSSLDTLLQLPPALLPVFLQQLKTYDLQFPIEQQEIRRRLAFVQAYPSSVASFRRIHVPPRLKRPENVAAPVRFRAETSAWLWSSLQMDAYRDAAAEFVRLYQAADPPAEPAVARLLVLVIGKDASVSAPLFQKLRAHGQVRSSVNVEGAAEAILSMISHRAADHSAPYAHWYVDGGDPLPGAAGELTRLSWLSWPALAPMNRAVLEHIQSCIANGSGPEVLQEQLAELPLRHASTGAFSDDLRLQHFALSLLTECSGTQIFATTFVQTAIREILRRAQPTTLLARFAPRQRQKSFNAMVEDVAHGARDLDPDGSLVDADMAAYYAYLELMRLPGAAQASLLVWHEDRPLVFAAGPRIPKGTYTNSPCTFGETLSDLLGQQGT